MYHEDDLLKEWYYKNVNDYQRCMFEGLNERSPIHFQNERERKIFKNCNEVNNI